MSIVTISRGSYSKGKEIAEQLSSALDYECISRYIILETSDHFKIPELKMVRAIHDAPSILDRLKYRKEKFVAYFAETFLENMRRDNIVYHGLAGHFFLQGVPNVLKVRIIANLEDRIVEEMKRESISEKEARRILLKDDEERRKWSLHVYGIDTNDPSLYDIVFHIDNLSVQDAVETLVSLARRPCFQTTESATRSLADAYLAARVKVALADTYANADVLAKEGVVAVTIDAAMSMTKKVQDEVDKLARGVPGVKELHVSVEPIDVD